MTTNVFKLAQWVNNQRVTLRLCCKSAVLVFCPSIVERSGRRAGQGSVWRWQSEWGGSHYDAEV